MAGCSTSILAFCDSIRCFAHKERGVFGQSHKLFIPGGIGGVSDAPATVIIPSRIGPDEMCDRSEAYLRAADAHDFIYVVGFQV